MPPVVLLPGMMLDERVFALQVAHLSLLTDVSVADLSAGETIEDMASRVLERAPERFAVVGLSMGGIVGLEIWRQAQHRITHLALMGTTPYADRPERSEERRQQMTAVADGRLRDVLVNSLLPSYLAARNRFDRNMLQQILDMGLTLGPEVFRRQSIALSRRVDSLATLSTIYRPTLVLCGREDALCPVRVHQTMAEAIPCADLVVLAECGHLSPLEEPAAVNDALQSLLRRVA